MIYRTLVQHKSQFIETGEYLSNMPETLQYLCQMFYLSMATNRIRKASSIRKLWKSAPVVFLAYPLIFAPIL
uniref:Uncharacterized protein n=1 Tax=Romanomermis culicivorax TaxID=13658 RepID=A0A915JP90_ROMCU